MSDSSQTLWTVAHQVPLSMGFSRQEYQSGLPFPSPGNLPDPGIKLASAILTGRFFTTEPSGKLWKMTTKQLGFYKIPSFIIHFLCWHQKPLLPKRISLQSITVWYVKLHATIRRCFLNTSQKRHDKFSKGQGLWVPANVLPVLWTLASMEISGSRVFPYQFRWPLPETVTQYLCRARNLRFFKKSLGWVQCRYPELPSGTKQYWLFMVPTPSGHFVILRVFLLKYNIGLMFITYIFFERFYKHITHWAPRTLKYQSLGPREVWTIWYCQYARLSDIKVGSSCGYTHGMWVPPNLIALVCLFSLYHNPTKCFSSKQNWGSKIKYHVQGHAAVPW